MPATTARQSRRTTAQPSVQRLEARRLFSSYTLTNLGTLGGTTARAYDLNDAGDVVGASTTATGQSHAFVWRNGVMTDLGTLGGASSQATAISHAGRIVGAADVNGSSSAAFLWQGGAMTNLRLGDGSVASGVNDFGQVVGTAGGAGFLWQNGATRDIGNLGAPGGVAADINNAGQVVGTAPTGETGTLGLSVSRAFRWQAGATTDLGMPFGSYGSNGVSISGNGMVAGGSSFIVSVVYAMAPVGHAMFYDGSTMTTLPVMWNMYSVALGVNDAGQVVGQNGTNGAFLYDHGVMSNLNSLIPAGSGVTLLAATSINKSGQIVAYSTGAQPRAFLLTPVPPPRAIPVNDSGLNVAERLDSARLDVGLI